jgi:hypothetical protein
MPTKNGKNTIFILTRSDVVAMVTQVQPNIDAEKTVTDDFLARVRKGVEWGLSTCWPDVMKTAVEETLPISNRQRSLDFN